MQFMFTVWMRKGGNANVPSQSSSRSVNLLIFFRELARFQVSSNMMRIGNQESAILIKVEAEDQRNQNRRKQHKRPNNQANIFFRLCVQNLVGRQIHFFSLGMEKSKISSKQPFFSHTQHNKTTDNGQRNRLFSKYSRDFSRKNNKTTNLTFLQRIGEKFRSSTLFFFSFYKNFYKFSICKLKIFFVTFHNFLCYKITSHLDLFQLIFFLNFW